MTKKSENEHLEKQKEQFINMYEEAFGVKPKLDDLNKEEYSFSLQYYGVKCNWM